MNDVSFPLAFLAGLLSFLSPCVLPLVPAYLSFVTGMSLEELTHKPRISKAMVSTLFFILGFSAVFISLGASSSLLGGILMKYQDWLRIGGGVLTIIFGLFIAGVFRLDFLMREKRFHISKGPTGYVGSFLIGMSFAAGWTPCIGPILGTILIYAGSQGSASYGLKLLTVYSLGLAIPFVLATFAVNLFFTYTRKIQKFMRGIMLTSGLILILFGVMLLTDSMGRIAGILPDFGLKM
ncbi:MAG: cytochrome c biogenesis protein CcdA [Nitrospirales bacterium]|nr:cytochrome c biogenesis protein CcdA [Nitrospirales bacterium]